jgi:hypothetical protein
MIPPALHAVLVAGQTLVLSLAVCSFLVSFLVLTMSCVLLLYVLLSVVYVITGAGDQQFGACTSVIHLTGSRTNIAAMCLTAAWFDG